MRRNSLTIIAGGILLVIFGFLLFTFQVRHTEIAVVTTFDNPAAKPIDEPGLHGKWPYPIQKVYKFDKRVQNFEDQFQETPTSDGYNLLVMLYVGWTINDPALFFNSFSGGSVTVAQQTLDGLIRSAKTVAVGRHPFSDFVSTNPTQLKFTEIESEMLKAIKTAAATKYGINVEFLGIKKLGLPEGVTQKVFDRMTAERQREIDRLRAQGEAEATKIRSKADRDKNEILANADAAATRIRGEAEAAAAKSFAAFKESPDLAVFLLELNALEQTLRDKSTLILDENTRPYNLLNKSFGHPDGTSKK